MTKIYETEEMMLLDSDECNKFENECIADFIARLDDPDDGPAQIPYCMWIDPVGTTNGFAISTEPFPTGGD